MFLIKKNLKLPDGRVLFESKIARDRVFEVFLIALDGVQGHVGESKSVMRRYDEEQEDDHGAPAAVFASMRLNVAWAIRRTTANFDATWDTRRRNVQEFSSEST